MTDYETPTLNLAEIRKAGQIAREFRDLEERFGVVLPIGTVGEIQGLSGRYFLARPAGDFNGPVTLKINVGGILADLEDSNR